MYRFLYVIILYFIKCDKYTKINFTTLVGRLKFKNEIKFEYIK